MHFTNDCNLNCPICFRPKKSNGGKDCKFFFDLIPYLSELTPQIALGGGEPFLYPQFIREFSRRAKDYELITNVTTNGTLPSGEFLKNVEMVSISFDKHKVKNVEDLNRFEHLVDGLKKYTRVGCNLLVDGEMFKSDFFEWIISYLFKEIGVERVFTLYPKNWEFIDILSQKVRYHLLTERYKYFYIDDLTSQIINENSYSNWKKPCHYGKGIVSISEDGIVTGCSFSKTPVLKLKEPEDIMILKDIDIEDRYSCPYLKLK